MPRLHDFIDRNLAGRRVIAEIRMRELMTADFMSGASRRSL